MRKYLILILGALIVLMCLICFEMSAQNTVAGKIVMDGKTYGLHKVVTGETLYSIAKKHAVDITELIIVNRIGESGYSINVNDMLVIPFYAKETVLKVQPVIEDTGQYLIHIVKQGETLYSIARNYNGITAKMLKESNNLPTDTLRISQQIIVPQRLNNKAIFQKSESTNPNVAQATSPSVKVVMDESPKKKTHLEATLSNLQQQFESADTGGGGMEANRGIGTWLDNDRSDSKKNFYALHKYAPIGTVIKVRNLMNNQVVYVKVIGKLPDNDENKNYIIKISGAAAQYLNILDERFLVELILPAVKS